MVLPQGPDSYEARFCVRITENLHQRVGRKGEDVILKYVQVIIHLHTIRHFYPSSLLPVSS